MFSFLSDRTNARIHAALRMCDREDRLAARFYVLVKSECGCCTFYRGVAIGMAAGAFAVWVF